MADVLPTSLASLQQIAESSLDQLFRKETAKHFWRLLIPSLLICGVISVLVGVFAYGILSELNLWSLRNVGVPLINAYHTTINEKIGGIMVAVFVYGFTAVPGILFAAFSQDSFIADVERRLLRGTAVQTRPRAFPLMLSGIKVAIMVLAAFMATLIIWWGLGWTAGVVAGVVLNGIAMGRGNYDAVALRHVSRVEADLVRRTNRPLFLMLGVLTGVIGAIPVCNLLTAMFGTSLMLHGFRSVTGMPAAKAVTTEGAVVTSAIARMEAAAPVSAPITPRVPHLDVGGEEAQMATTAKVEEIPSRFLRALTSVPFGIVLGDYAIGFLNYGIGAMSFIPGGNMFTFQLSSLIGGWGPLYSTQAEVIGYVLIYVIATAIVYTVLGSVLEKRRRLLPVFGVIGLVLDGYFASEIIL